MEGNNGNQGGQHTQNGQQKSGLSWSQPAGISGGSAQQNNKPQMQPQHSILQPTQKNSSKKIIWSVIGVVVVVGLVVWAFNATREPTDDATGAVATTTQKIPGDIKPSDDTTAPTSPDVVVGAVDVGGGSDNSLTISSPQDSGLQVAVSNISVSVPTWVVVYESRNGQPGNVLGAALFVAGRTSGAVELLRATLPGQTYFAGQARDDGDHIFSMQSDMPVRGTNGDPVWAQFQTR